MYKLNKANSKTVFIVGQTVKQCCRVLSLEQKRL